MSSKRRDILTSDDKGIGSARGLGVLWRKILALLNIRPDTWVAHLNHYLNDPSNQVKNDPKSRATERGNLEKALFAEDFSWGQLIKGIKVLSYSLKRVRIEIHLQTLRGEDYVVSQDLIVPKEEKPVRRRKYN